MNTSSLFQHSATLAGAALLAGVVYFHWYDAAPVQPAIGVTASAAAPAPQERPPPGRRAPRLAGMHLFGAHQPETGKQPAIESAPETQLQLSLTGLITGPAGEQGWAIIAGPGGKQAHYAIGDPLPGRAALHAVQDRKAIIKRSARFESLSLPVASLDDPPVARDARALPRRAPARQHRRIDD